MSNPIDYALDHFKELAAIPSPTGYTKRASEWLVERFTKLGFPPAITRKGVLQINLGGAGHPLAIASHVDTLGAMVRAITPEGRLRLTNIGGLSFTAIDTENCEVHTRDGRTYTGVVQMPEASAHVHKETYKIERTAENLDVFLDEKASNPDEVKALGIRVGDFVTFDPRTRVTPSGFVKSRHIDDKACVALLLALARDIREGRVKPARKVWAVITTYEETGHGGADSAPREVEDYLVLDMGCVGDDLSGSIFKVSICAKDSSGPFDYDVTTRLIQLAQRDSIPHAIDTFPYYTSDAAVGLRAGYDVRHGLIGPGVFASHGYERTHRDALDAAYKLLCAYVQDPVERT